MAQKDELTLTIRLHDPKEKKDAKLRADWNVQQIPREDLAMPIEEFMQRYVVPAFIGLAQIKATVPAAEAASVPDSPVAAPIAAASSNPSAEDASAQAKP